MQQCFKTREKVRKIVLTVSNSTPSFANDTSLSSFIQRFNNDFSHDTRVFHGLYKDKATMLSDKNTLKSCKAFTTGVVKHHD
jgi:hypothetical protein